MLRQSLLCSVVLLTLTACGPDAQYVVSNQAAPGAAEIPETVLITGSMIRAAGPKLAYTHSLAIEMADDKVAPRYDRARTACLEDQTLNCNLLEASITVGNANAGIRPNASLSVRLPHDSVAKFQAGLLEPLPDEGPGEPSVRRSSTNAEDLTLQITDNDRRLAQATDYRDRLTVLSRRGDAKVDDLIQVQEKLSEVQSSIEAMTIESRQLNTRVDTEMLNISLGSYDRLTSVASPLGEAWRNAARELGRSAASAFLFVVVLLPWVPLVALGGFIAVRLWRLVRSVRQRKAQVAAV